jgi:diguanylate cyclase (GGDEF)-like protein
MMGKCIKAIALLVCVLGCFGLAHADTPNVVDALLSESLSLIRSAPETASVPLAKLQALRDSFTPEQNHRYHAIYAKYLGFQGRHEERIALVQSIIGQVTKPSTRASLLYDLVDGNRALGHYESALQAMNESILLLPSIEGTGAKLLVLNGAVTLLTTLRAYDEALVFAERMIALDTSKPETRAQCHGLTNKIELNFKLGDRQLAQSLVPQAVQACDVSKEHMLALLVKSYVAIDLIDSGQYAKGITTSLPLVQQFQTVGTGSNWLAAVEEALARAYLKTGDMERAEYFGTKAYQRAQAAKDLDWQEKTSETMATIKRAQGQLAAAIGYYEINLAFKKRAFDDQQQKSLAYQRVKFENQDKANQMALLEQKNKTLNIETALQKGKYQNLVLLLTLGMVALTILGAGLVRTLRQKNRFRKSAQIDGLTEVSNRAHFTECAQKAFNDKNSVVSLVLFDMDFFKKINDTYGHATGDWVLKAVCHTVRRRLPKEAILGRMGGEEFAVCLPNFSEQETRDVAERCRKAIATVDSRHSGFNFQMTASFGIATRFANGTLSFEEALAAADKALYFSKNEGRNRVTVYQHSDAFRP